MSVKNLQIIHAPTSESPFLVIAKPAGLPSAPLRDGDESVLARAIEMFPVIAEIHGKKEIEHGLVHRIDTETSGLVLIASTQESYDALISSQRDGLFEKWYRADCDFIPDCAETLGAFPPYPAMEKIFEKTAQKALTLEVKSAFRPFGEKGREVRPVTESSGRAALKKSGARLYKTEIQIDANGSALCHISAGYRHQVRCHLAWCGFPVKGDRIYNPRDRKLNESNGKEHDMRFEAVRISFPHPLTKVPLAFQM